MTSNPISFLKKLFQNHRMRPEEFTVTPLKLIMILCFAFACIATDAAPDPSNFTPDFSKSDIYLSYLNRTPLSGWWKINKVSSDRKNNPEDDGIKGKFYSLDFDDSKWQRDIVPNIIQIPFENYIPSSGWGETQSKIPQQVREWGGIAYFRKDFDAPEMKSSERAILHFEEVCGAFTIYINGEKLGEEEPYIAPTEYKGPRKTYDFDITQQIQPGKKNNITIRLFHDGHPVRWGWSGYAGITDMVWLDIRPAAYTLNILATPRKNLSEVDFDCIVSGSNAPADRNGWTGEVFEWKSGKTVASVSFAQPVKSDDLILSSGTASIKNPGLWSPESPFLYGIRVRNSRGEITGVQRFGMRTLRIENGNFLLNNKPILLAGLTTEDPMAFYKYGWLFAFKTNYDNAYGKYWQYFREANVNHVRLHSSTKSRSNYDVLDELGIIVVDELSYPETAIKSPSRADLISVKGFDGACDAQGNLLPEFQTYLKERIRRAYSHPCICTYSFGNEICYDYKPSRTVNMLNNIYDLYAKTDKQQRPRTSSSGRAAPESIQYFDFLSKNEKSDYLDMHDYSGSLRQTPFFQALPLFAKYLESVKKCYGPAGIPIVNGETVYYGEFFYNYYKGIWSSPDADEPNWDKLLFIFNGEMRAKEQMAANLSFYWCRNWGTKNYIFNRPATRAISIERIIENQRRSWPDVDGFEALTEPIKLGKAYPFNEIQFEHIPEWTALQRSCSPVIAIFDWIPQNRFAGEAINANLNVINNKENAVKDIIFEASIVDSNGKLSSKKSLKVGSLACGERKSFQIEFTVPESEGASKLNYRLVSDGTVLNEREYGLNIRKRNTVFAPIKTTKKIAVYDSSSLFGDLKPFSTTKMLKDFGIEFTSVKSFDKLESFDILIIGSSSVDSNLKSEAQFIRAFVEKGGRLLAFEQNEPGRIPFLQELEYTIAGPVEFTEILKKNHPAVKNVRQDELFGWNQKDFSVYHAFITPVSKAAVSSGANTAVWGASAFGMTTAHLKLGAGDMLLSQTDLTSTYENDSGSSWLARQLLLTILDDATRTAAAEFAGLPPLKTSPLSSKDALTISLKKAANMAFADEIDNDGKGGWTDQGSSNDLRPFPTGKIFLGGVPFEIINPLEAKSSSCVVSANVKGRVLPSLSKEIDVNAKLKRLVFLHASAWTPDEEGVLMGEYIVTYESGRKQSIPLRSGENIRDWWGAPTQKVSKADCIWSKENNTGIVGVYLYEWKNPSPDDKILNIVLKADKAVIGLVGLTGEKQ